jgi:polyisoprenoid-binding protein YceI
MLASKEDLLMHRIVRSLSLAACLLAPVLGEAATWELDPVHSSIAFSIRHMMISSVRGQFRTFSGTATGDPSKPADATIEATIDAASIDTGNEKRDTDLKSPNFFDVEKFPKITFKSKKIESAGPGKAKVTGDLTMHGVTKEVVLDVEGPTAPIKDPMGNTKAGAHATTKINRKDFGITWNKAMDGGGIMVGDDVDVTIDVEAAKKSD